MIKNVIFDIGNVLLNFDPIEYVTKKYNFSKVFDGGVVSYNEKLLKPEQEIYEKILDNYGLKSQETVFIDDMDENVEAAMRIGIRGIILDDKSCLRTELKKFDINIQ